MIPECMVIQAPAYSHQTMMLNDADKCSGMNSEAFDRWCVCMALAFRQHGGRFASIAV